MAIIQQLLIHGVQQTHITFEASTVGATTDFVVPAGVTNINIMAVGGGGGGSVGGSSSDGGCGGGLVWTDGVSVTPGEILEVCAGPGGPGQDQWNSVNYNDCDGHTSYVQRQSNGNYIVKAYGGGYYGQYGGEGMFTEGNGVIKTGGDGHRNSGLGGNGWPRTQWPQGGDNSYKGQTGGNNTSSGSVGVPLVFGETGGTGGAASGFTNGSTGVGGLYGGAGGKGLTGGGITGKGGDGGDGAVRISWDTPIGDGTPNIDGRSSVQFKGSYNYQYLIVTPPTPNYFQLGDSDWTMEFWWRPHLGAPSQSYWNNGGVGTGCPFIEGLDENNRVTWKIAPAQTNSPSWYHQNQANKDAYGGNGENAELRWYLGGDHILTHGGDSENGSDGWRHIVFERIGTGLYLFVHGMRTHQYSGSNGDLFQFAQMPDLNDTSTKRIAIGGHGQGSGSTAAIGGQISNVRVVTGRAVYSQDAWNSNHIEPVKQIPDTKLIACSGPTVDTVYFGYDENTVVGQKEYTVAGTYSWTCPADVTSVSVVCIGGGGGSSTPGQTWTGTGAGDGGAGGGLGWKNNISVTPGQSYTVVVGGNDAPAGEQEWTTPGTYTWTCPAGVTSVSAVCVGGGGGNNNQQWSGGGGGGALAWKNNISVTPGQTYTVEVGAAGLRASGYYPGGTSYFVNQTTVAAGGGWPDNDIWTPANAAGGTVIAGDGGGSGGRGGLWNSAATSQSPHITTAYGGGGGAGGYSGNGGDGGSNDTNATVQVSAGTGGAGGGGVAIQDFGQFTNGAFDTTHGGGGGVGLLGEGASGAAGWNSTGNRGGFGGSGGAQGLETLSYQGNSTPGTYGPGSGGQFGGGSGGGGDAGHGAVRIIWGPGRAFPSTSTENRSSDAGTTGGDSYFINSSTVKGGGGQGGKKGTGNGIAQGGDYVGDGGGNGGNGGGTRAGNNGTGGGGAGGYSGNGGNGATSGAGQDGTGGGAGGGGSDSVGSVADGRYGAVAGGGGGTGIWGEGSNGVGGGDDDQAPTVVGKGGSKHWMSEGLGVVRIDPATGGWLNGDGRHPPWSQGGPIYNGAVAGGYYGGGAGADAGVWGPAGEGAPTGGGDAWKGCTGAVRIIWGSGRSFPSTNTEDLNNAIYGYNADQAPHVYTNLAENPTVESGHPFDSYDGGIS